LCWLLYKGHQGTIQTSADLYIYISADFLSELLTAADKVLIVGDFNVDNEKDALRLAFKDFITQLELDNMCQDPLIVVIIL